MENCCHACGMFCHINWLWFVVAIAAAYAVGAIWYSFLFSKTWMRIFKVEIPEKVDKTNMIITMFIQLIATAIFGLVYFVLVPISVWLAILALVGFCAWQKGSLKFQFSSWKEFATAALVQAGFTFITGVIFILFALL